MFMSNKRKGRPMQFNSWADTPGYHHHHGKAVRWICDWNVEIYLKLRNEKQLHMYKLSNEKLFETTRWEQLKKHYW